MNEKLQKEYFEIDYNREMYPYKRYVNALEQVFDLTIADSFIDLGCNNGKVLEVLFNKYSHLALMGVDYFAEWSKKYADDSVREKIFQMDLSHPQNFGGKRYDFVNCSEVGEHIEKSGEQNLLDNLAKVTKQTLILTWSNQPSHDNDQHQNPRPKKYIISEIEKRGLMYWEAASKSLSEALKNEVNSYGFQWWSHDIMVFKRVGFFPTHNQYFIQQINTDNINHKKFFNKAGLCNISLQQSFINLKNIIYNLAKANQGGTILRASDGDYFFLREIPIGSAKPGKRALTLPYEKLNMSLFRKMFWQNDVITTSIEKTSHRDWKNFIIWEWIDTILRKKFAKGSQSKFAQTIKYVSNTYLTWLFANKLFLWLAIKIITYKKGNAYKLKARSIANKTFIPMEAVYGLLANKWIYRNFKNQIGIITGGPKLELIKELMKYKEYSDYLGVDEFTDYIEIPQKGAADDLTGLVNKIGEQIKQSKAKIFLVAAGSSKIGLMPLLRQFSNAVFIDAGCGVDALAGVVCQDRPYFADWVNFRLKNYDYSKVDFMDQNSPGWKNLNYKTKLLENL